MTETRSDRKFVPGLGKGWLTPFYDLVHRLSGVGSAHREMIRLADPRPGQRVLDVGCATGNLLLALGRDRPDLELVGLDPDARALAIARRKAGRAGLAVDWRRGFGEELPLPDASVDRVFSSLMLHHLGPAAKAGLLAEVRRVLRPDGVLVLADMDGHGRGAHNPFGRRMATRLHDNGGLPERIAGAGFTVDPTVQVPIRRIGELSIVRARPAG